MTDDREVPDPDVVSGLDSRIRDLIELAGSDAPVSEGESGAETDGPRTDARRSAHWGRRLAATGVAASIVVIGVLVWSRRDDDSIAPIQAVPSTVIAWSADDERPVLGVGGVPYGPVWWRMPSGMPSTVIYADGTAVSFDIEAVDPDSDTPSGRFTMQTAEFDDGDLASIQAALVTAGLVDDTEHPQVILPDNGVVDGGATVFWARHGEDVASVVVDNLGTRDDESPRRELAAVSSAVAAARDDASWTSVEIRRWVVRSTTMRDAPPTDDDGLDLGTPNWVETGTGMWCAIVSSQGWDLAPGPIVAGQVSFRPAFPHEHTCDDVAASDAIFRPVSVRYPPN